MSVITVDLNPASERHNPKQRQFFDDVMREVSKSQRLEIIRDKIKNFPGDGNQDELDALEEKCAELQSEVENGYRYFAYGGAVSGGKTIISLTILVILCKIYPQSRWHIVRASSPDLTRTVNESLSFILRNSAGVKWIKRKDEWFVQFSNGSRIYFLAESYDRDKDLNRFKGLMTNGFLLEQAEELQKKTFDKAIERAGRWYGVRGPMPPPIILLTFNPTFGWLKKLIYDKWKKGTLQSPFYYLFALPDDNPWNSEEQWRSWSNMDPETYDRFIKGIWDVKISNQFFHQFSSRNIGTTQLDARYDIWISFDFNVDPMTCIIAQTDHVSFLHVIKEFRIENSDTYELCEQIKPIIYGREHVVKVTGDASGRNRMSGARGHINHYAIIQTELGLKTDQFEVPPNNPGISESRAFVNSILYRFPTLIVDESCEYLIEDLKFVETDIDRNGQVGIKKTGVNNGNQKDNRTMGHLSDTFRYLLHSTLHDWFR